MIVRSPRPEVNDCLFIQTESLFACLCVHDIGEMNYRLIAGIASYESFRQR
jgi:hypothetical protein